MKLKHTLLILSLSILFFGCEDFLTRNDPKGITDDDFWETSNQVESALNLCYRLPHGTHHYTAPYASMVHFEGMTDNSYHGADFNGWIVRIANGTITAEDEYMRDFWKEYYKNIRNCCRLLENIDKAFFVEEVEREKIRGEVIILRAYYHWELLKYYGLTRGIPIVDHTLTPNENFMERSSVDAVISFILSELDRAIAINQLPFKYDDSRKTKVDRSVAFALKAIVCLNMKRYEEAISAAKTIIDSGEYELFYTNQSDDDPGKNFRDLFRSVGQNNKERILYTSEGLKEAFFRLAGPGLGQQATSWPTLSIVNAFETAQGKTLEELGRDSVDFYSKDPLGNNNRDPRLYATIVVPGDNTTFASYTYDPWGDGSEAVGKPNASRTGFMLKKFVDPLDRNSPWSGKNNFYIIRYAEILLTYVECLIESGNWQNPDVITYINAIRKRAGQVEVNATTYNTQEKVRELLRRERRVELAFEGVRYIDIRRWDIAKEVMNGPVYGAVNPATGERTQIETRNYKVGKSEVWPIPQSEIFANENLQQNPGYEGE